MQIPAPRTDCYTRVRAPIEPAATIDPATTAMLQGFQSIGVDCEFGLVQRRFGVEASSLMRWATTPLRPLIRMLDNDFAGIGDPALTSLRRASWGEFFLVDHTYDLYNHTFILDTGVDRPALLQEQCSRQRYLVKKLIKVLRDHDTIFVFKHNEVQDPSDAVALYTALSRFGSNRLLWVTPGPAPSERPGGALRTGLVFAQIDRPGPRQAPNGSDWDIDFDRWVGLCGDARRALDASRTEIEGAIRPQIVSMPPLPSDPPGRRTVRF